MEEMPREIVLYGLKDYEETIEKVIKELDYEQNYFNMKLILTESLSNAFKHGNNSDTSKPIYLRYNCIKNKIKLEIEDMGSFSKNITFPKEIALDDTLDDGGRGLFLINCFADNVEFKNNILTIEINKCNDGKRKGDII